MECKLNEHRATVTGIEFSALTNHCAPPVRLTLQLPHTRPLIRPL